MRSYEFVQISHLVKLLWIGREILYCEKGPEAVFPLQAKEVQPATGDSQDSGLQRGLSVPLYPTSKIFISPEWGKGLRKSFWTPHTQLTLSLNCCCLAGATEHWAPKQPDTRTVFTPRSYPTWTTHHTPQYCTSVNNSSNLHLYIQYMHIHSSAYGHFLFSVYLYFMTIIIHNYCLFSSLLVFLLP